jgi:hypothetical protein
VLREFNVYLIIDYTSDSNTIGDGIQPWEISKEVRIKPTRNKEEKAKVRLHIFLRSIPKAIRYVAMATANISISGSTLPTPSKAASRQEE